MEKEYWKSEEKDTNRDEWIFGQPSRSGWKDGDLIEIPKSSRLYGYGDEIISHIVAFDPDGIPKVTGNKDSS
uniref:Uncharacterized protein n=1 Tax=Vespula pensylvanica TaxID=30213 RepID=A0A834P6L5_VESPE|nr:hypothetical protein H0235_006486 [Vespula pensylvanica]